MKRTYSAGVINAPQSATHRRVAPRVGGGTAVRAAEMPDESAAACETANASTQPVDSWRVASSSTLAERGGRLHVTVEGRSVSVVDARADGGGLHCIDRVCYHAGALLTDGPIEEVAGRLSIVCPWHSYKVTLDTGEKLYRGTKFNEVGKLEPTGWASAGKRQRVHVAYEEEGEIYVQLNHQGSLESDRYACRERR